MTPIIPPPKETPVERASVGCRVWFWLGQAADPLTLNPLSIGSSGQAFDAGVLYVHADGRVNLLVTDHFGEQRVVHGAALRNPSPQDQHRLQEFSYATWMPYQVKKGGAA